MLFFEQRRRRLTAKLAAYVRAGVCVRVCAGVGLSLCACVSKWWGQFTVNGHNKLPTKWPLWYARCVCECLCVWVCLRACVRFPRSRSTKLRNCNSLAVTQLGAYGSSSSLYMRSSRSVCVCVWVCRGLCVCACLAGIHVLNAEGSVSITPYVCVCNVGVGVCVSVSARYNKYMNDRHDQQRAWARALAELWRYVIRDRDRGRDRGREIVEVACRD